MPLRWGYAGLVASSDQRTASTSVPSLLKFRLHFRHGLVMGQSWLGAVHRFLHLGTEGRGPPRPAELPCKLLCRDGTRHSMARHNPETPSVVQRAKGGFK